MNCAQTLPNRFPEILSTHIEATWTSPLLPIRLVMSFSTAFVSTTAVRFSSNSHRKNLTTRRSRVICSAQDNTSISRRSFSRLCASSILASVLVQGTTIDDVAAARPEGVNRPELLPKEYTTVIDLERFMATGEVKRLTARINELERRTGFKVRVLTQRFPQTPGLAIRDYWSVDDNTVVMVADYFGGSGQLLKFNVGKNVDVLLPPRFWSLLSSKLGNKFYVERNGEADAIIKSVETIRMCLLNNGCNTPPDLDPTF